MLALTYPLARGAFAVDVAGNMGQEWLDVWDFEQLPCRENAPPYHVLIRRSRLSPSERALLRRFV